uniref:Uncharacterized protein n=1 Tax=Chloropicon laureae TaxID=464258 RepID=A0A7S2Z3J1_9CHLO
MMMVSSSSADEELASVVTEKLNLPGGVDGNAAAQAAKRLLAECLPDLLKATESGAGAKRDRDGSAHRKASLQLWTACFLYIGKRVSVKERSGAAASEPSGAGDAANGNKSENGSSAADNSGPMVRLRDAEVERSFTISQLLRASDLSFVEFAREMKHILARVKPKILEQALTEATGADSPGLGANGGGVRSLESALELAELSMDFCHMSALFSKYKDKFQHLFTSDSEASTVANPNLSPASKKQGQQKKEGSEWETDAWFRLGWLAFIACKAALLPKFVDLVSCASLLVCVLNFLLAHVPPSRLRKPLNDAVAYPVRTSTGATYTLGCVGLLMHAHLQDAQKLMPRVDVFLKELLSKDPVIERYEPVVDAVIMTGCGNYKGLLAVGAAERQLEILDKAYEKSYRLSGEIDARDFAETASSKALGNSSKMTPRLNKRNPLSVAQSLAGQPGSGGIKLKETRSWPSPFIQRRPAGSVPQSPALLNRVAPPTPISEAMAASHWLRKAVSQHMKGTSPELDRIFALCTSSDSEPAAGTSQGGSKDVKDLRGKIEAYVAELADKVLPAVGSPLGKRKAQESGTSVGTSSNSFTSEAERRKKEGIALYFHILEAMLLAEEKRNKGAQVLVALLQNKQLCLALVCLGFEILSFCYKMTALSFPTVLDRLGIGAFDLCKVIEPLVRSECGLNLPKELKRHLFAIEERSLESLSWKPGSTFYKHMVACFKDNSGQEDAAASQQQQSSAFQKVQPLPKCFGRPEDKTSLGSPSEKSLVAFLQKVCKLCTFRLIDLCNRLSRDRLLEQGETVLEQSISIMTYVIYEKTSLLYNRHVDQIMLATLYGVMKVNQIKITFRDIVHHYGKQSQASSHVYRAVVLKQSFPDLQVEESGDIILFYNRVFVPAIQVALLGLTANQGAASESEGGGGGGREKQQREGRERDQREHYSPTVCATRMPEYKKQEYLLASPSNHSMFTFIGSNPQDHETPSKRFKTINKLIN